MGKSFEELWAEMTGKQHDAFKMKVWAALGGRETGEAGMKRLMSGQARLVLEDVAQKAIDTVKSEWRDLLDTCHQYSVSFDFTELRFPLEPIATDENDWEVVEHYLTKTGTLEHGVKQLEKLAAKGEIRLLAGSRRAMKYIAQHQDAQLDCPIILPFRAQNSSGCWCLPVFHWAENCGRRDLYLAHTTSGFFPHYSWLVFKRKQK